MSDAIEGVGLIRVLDGIDAKIGEVVTELRALDSKVDKLADKKVDKTEFDAYKELRVAMEQEAKQTRISGIRWSITTIVAVLALLATAVGLIISTRPDIQVVSPPENHAIVRVI